MTIFIHILPVFDVEIMNNSSLIRKKNKTEKANIDTNKWQVDNEFDCGVFPPILEIWVWRTCEKKQQFQLSFDFFPHWGTLLGRIGRLLGGGMKKEECRFYLKEKKHLTTSLPAFPNEKIWIFVLLNLWIYVLLWQGTGTALYFLFL